MENYDGLVYEEEFDSDDYFTEALRDDLVYIEDFDLADYGIEESYEDEEEESAPLNEDLNSSLPFKPMDESAVREAAKKVVKGAKVQFGYFKEIKLDAKYAQGKFVKKDNRQYETVKAIKVTNFTGCTGVRYESTEGARALHSTQKYQDRLADKMAATGKGFGTNVHDSEAGLENILIMTSTGKKCVLVYPLSNGKPRNTYYISVDGEDWRQTSKDEIAKYMSFSRAEDFLHPENSYQKKVERQAQVYADGGVAATITDELTIVSDTGEKLKVMTHPVNVTYKDPISPFFGIFRFDKESSIVDVEEPEPEAVKHDPDNPFEQDFPEVER